MGNGDKERRLDAATWQRIPVFAYQAPPVRWAWPALLVPALALALWAVGLSWLGLKWLARSPVV